MHIGLTYDLRQDYLDRGWCLEEAAEFDSPDTIEALADALEQLGHRVTRIGGCRRLAEALSAGGQWDLVFNIAEGAGGRSREAQVPALLEAFNIPYTMSDPLTCALTLDKALAKRMVRDHGLPTAEFTVVEEVDDVARVELSFPLFAKPNAEGTGKGITHRSILKSRADLEEVCSDLLVRYHQPVVVETYLPGREVTVGVLGTGRHARAIGVMEIGLKPEAESGVYSLFNKEYCEGLVDYRLLSPDGLAREAAELAVSAYRALECRDVGRVDLKADAQGRWHFLEVNPLPGLHPTHSDLPIVCNLVGIGFVELIEAIVSSALLRANGDTT